MSSRGSAKRQKQQALKSEARRSSRKGVRLLTVLVVGIMVLLGVGVALFGGEGSASPRAGLVWSPEHGHWH